MKRGGREANYEYQPLPPHRIDVREADLVGWSRGFGPFGDVVPVIAFLRFGPHAQALGLMPVSNIQTVCYRTYIEHGAADDAPRHTAAVRIEEVRYGFDDYHSQYIFMLDGEERSARMHEDVLLPVEDYLDQNMRGGLERGKYDRSRVHQYRFVRQYVQGKGPDDPNAQHYEVAVEGPDYKLLATVRNLTESNHPTNGYYYHGGKWAPDESGLGPTQPMPPVLPDSL